MKNYSILIQWPNGKYSLLWARENTTLAETEKSLKECVENWQRRCKGPVTCFICSPKRAKRLLYPSKWTNRLLNPFVPSKFAGRKSWNMGNVPTFIGGRSSFLVFRFVFIIGSALMSARIFTIMPVISCHSCLKVVIPIRLRMARVLSRHRLYGMPMVRRSTVLRFLKAGRGLFCSAVVPIANGVFGWMITCGVRCGISANFHQNEISQTSQ